MLPFDPAELLELKDTDPEKYWSVISRLRAELPLDVVKAEHLKQLAVIASSEGVLGAFEAYYEGVHGNKLLPHNVEAAKEAFRAFEDGDIFLYHAARGFRKTTTFIVTMASWMIGLYPEKTSLITGANDSNAINIAKNIAQIVESHPFFKMCFPHVVIDKDRGWGADGYWVKNTKYTQEEWVKQQAKIIDPTFVGGGYKSSIINGRHPSLLLMVDDLHDIDSSSSVTERESIKTVFLTQILPTALKENDKLVTKIVMTGVPFAKDDTYEILKQSGGCRFVSVPAMKRAPEGEGVFIDGVNKKTNVVYEDVSGWWHLTCPEIMGQKSIVVERAKSKSAFWQMYMLDMNTAKTMGLTYYEYDSSKIGFALPTVGGADPTSIDPDKEVGGQKRSSFALCYLSKLPMGGAVITGGVLKPMGMVAAKDAILQAQAMFSNWETTGVEDVGSGKLFMQYLRTDSRVRFLPSNIKDPKSGRVKDKKTRFDSEVAPWLESGIIRISSERTPFLDALRYGFENFFDLDPNKPHESLDAMDSLYHAAKLIPEVLRKPVSEDISPSGLTQRNGLWHPLMGAANGKN